MSASPVLPGSTVGFLGGGQLGRMAALAAREMGYDVWVLDPDADCPACSLASHVIAAPFEDVRSTAELARHVDVVTIEIERVAVDGLRAAAELTLVHPDAGVLDVVQHRARQKAWLADHGFPVGDYRVAASIGECEAVVGAWGPCYIKASTGGYDGRGQVKVWRANECADAWHALRAERCVVERALDLDAEISVMVARRPSGDHAVYPVALNHHEAGQLAWSVLPAPIDPALASEARDLGIAITRALGVVGVLAVEMFVVRGNTLLVNELAPRPHNSFHHTIEACATSQFEQLVRAICDLPLGATELLQPAAIANVLGNAWQAEAGPDFVAALRVPGTRLHLYGKREARPARKMGHLAAVADTPIEARDRVLEAARRLRRLA